MWLFVDVVPYNLAAFYALNSNLSFHLSAFYRKNRPVFV